MRVPTWRWGKRLRSVMRGAVLVSLIAFAAPWPAPARCAERPATAAETDSLLWYIEELEFRLRVADVRRAAALDSARVDLSMVAAELRDCERERGPWLLRQLTSPPVMLTVGVIIGARAARIGGG